MTLAVARAGQGDWDGWQRAWADGESLVHQSGLAERDLVRLGRVCAELAREAGQAEAEAVCEAFADRQEAAMA